jgi:quercetin dioxygenase-like cupin family protein
MFKSEKEMLNEEKHALRGGNGDPAFHHLFSAAELGNRAELFASVTLRPGESIGVHAHVQNAEAYVVLRGTPRVTENGLEKRLAPGDAEFCADGNTHSIENDTAEPVEFLALILPNR